jgi:hypothetical protein
MNGKVKVCLFEPMRLTRRSWFCHKSYSDFKHMGLVVVIEPE